MIGRLFNTRSYRTRQLLKLVEYGMQSSTDAFAIICQKGFEKEINTTVREYFIFQGIDMYYKYMEKEATAKDATASKNFLNKMNRKIYAIGVKIYNTSLEKNQKAPILK